ncbi:MAG: calcium/sodium antiporter [Bacilli bacterium]|nr:calcium/sodium antiporter [Bacilli bacterium]
MITDIIFIILGFIILIKGADLFIDGISSTAINLKIAKIIISLTIVAFGTSAPELAISIQGMLNGNGSLVLANVIGSTIVNTMLVIGLAALVRPIKVQNETVKRQLPLHLITIIIFSLLYLLGNGISRADGLILILMFTGFLIYIIKFMKKKNSWFEKKEKPKWKISTSIIFSIIGLIAIFLGSNLAVNNCTDLAHKLGISEKLITMVVLVIGTSAPEITLAIASAKKKEFDIILGNIIGTNIFNIGFVLGLPVLLFGSVTSIDFTLIDMVLISLAGIIVYEFSKDDKIISKKEGIIMLTVFIEYYLYVFVTGL